MEAMKIKIPVQRKTSIESNQTPKQNTQKQPKTQISKCWAVWPLTGAVWPVCLAVWPLEWAVWPLLTVNRKISKISPTIRNEKRPNFWSVRPNFTKFEPHLPKDIRNLFQSKISEIHAKVPIFFSLSEGGSKTEPNAKYDLETCSWVIDDQDDPRWVRTCHSKLDQGKKPSKNSWIKERLKIIK